MEELRFEGRGLEYFKIWIVNVLLILVTLGLYYPWAKVRRKRYFYANTLLDGRNFEYHATGRQLFVGFLIAMVVFIVYVVVQQISQLGGLVVLGLFFLAVPWIVWRSMKFNMRMTSFSNVRFGFDGKLSGAYTNYLFIPLACTVSLTAMPILIATGVFGLGNSTVALVGKVFATAAIVFLILYLYAYLKKRNACYTINGSRFGQAQFSTEVETKEFAKIILKTIGMGLLVMMVFMLVIAFVAIAAIGLDGLAGMQEGTTNPEQLMKSGALALIGPVYLGMIVASFLVMAYSYTRQRTYIYQRSLLDDKIAIASTLQARSMAWVMSTNLLMVIISLGLALPWAQIRMARLVIENTQVNTDLGFDEYVSEKQEEQSSLGEQIGDAFDVDVGIAF